MTAHAVPLHAHVDEVLHSPSISDVQASSSVAVVVTISSVVVAAHAVPLHAHVPEVLHSPSSSDVQASSSCLPSSSRLSLSSSRLLSSSRPPAVGAGVGAAVAPPPAVGAGDGRYGLVVGLAVGAAVAPSLPAEEDGAGVGDQPTQWLWTEGQRTACGKVRMWSVCIKKARQSLYATQERWARLP